MHTGQTIIGDRKKNLICNVIWNIARLTVVGVIVKKQFNFHAHTVFIVRVYWHFIKIN